jgi:hypothetical protein
MIGSSVCRFRVMGLLLLAHHHTVGLPSQWCSFRGGEGHGFMLPQSLKGLYRKAIGLLFSEIGQEQQDVAHRNHAD